MGLMQLTTSIAIRVTRALAVNRNTSFFKGVSAYHAVAGKTTSSFTGFQVIPQTSADSVFAGRAK